MNQALVAKLLTALLTLLSTNTQTQTSVQSLITELQDAQKQIVLNTGDDLQAAMSQAPEGATIMLPPATTFTGHFVCSKPVTVTTFGVKFDDGQRANPSEAGKLAVLISPDGAPAFSAAPGVHDCALDSLEVHGGIQFADGTDSDPAALPVNPKIRHVLQDATGLKRAINLNSAGGAVVDSYVFGPKVAKQDSQAIWCNSCTGVTIRNNHLEAAGEVILFGGDRVRIANHVPSDITIEGNQFTRPIALQTQLGQWNVKNLLELKNGQRFQIRQNDFSNHWADAQQCYSIVFTPRDQYGDNPWTTVRDIVFEQNTLHNVGCGINIIGDDDHYPMNPRTTNIAIRDNVILAAKALGGSRGQCLLLGRAPQQVQYERNICLGDGSSAIYTYHGGAVTTSDGAVFRGNYWVHGTYGFLTDNATPPNQGLALNYPGAIWDGNVVAGGSAKTYPAGTTVLAIDAFKALFSDYVNGVLFPKVN